MSFYRKLKKTFKSAIIIFSASLVTLECVGFFIFDSRTDWDNRYLFFNKGAVINAYTETGAIWKYKPMSQVRTSAVWADFLGSKVEYDCLFNTNSLGFIDTVAPEGTIDYLVLGDSFTEGQGGCPWLTKEAILSDLELNDIKLLNGGLQGLGVLGFETILKHHLEKKIDIKNIIMIAITDDFIRHSHSKWDTESECYNKLICGKHDYWHFISEDDYQQSKLEQLSNIRRSQNPHLIKEILRYSFTYHILEEIKTISQSWLKQYALKHNLWSRYKIVSGDDIFAFNSDDIINEGLSEKEQWGRWSDGSQMEIQFKIASNSKNQSITFNLNAFLTAKYPEQTASVFINDKPAGNIQISMGEAQPKQFIFSLPDTEDNLYKIHFQIDRPISPKSLGLSEDVRELGFGFVNMKLSLEDLYPSSTQGNRYSALKQKWHNILKKIIHRLMPPINDHPSQIQKNIAALDRIKQQYPNMRLILVSTRSQVGLLGKEDYVSTTIKKYLNDNLYNYQLCNLAEGDFMPNDGHPNKSGYKKLFKCLKHSISIDQNNEKKHQLLAPPPQLNLIRQ